jgi:hypothetical protein
MVGSSGSSLFFGRKRVKAVDGLGNAVEPYWFGGPARARRSWCVGCGDISLLEEVPKTVATRNATQRNNRLQQQELMLETVKGYPTAPRR